MRGLQGDGGQLLDVGRGDDAAVGHDDHALVPEVGQPGVRDHATAHEVLSAGGLDHAQEGTQEGVGGRLGAADHAVRASVLHHHGSVVVRVEQERARVGEAESLVAVERLEKAGEIVEIGRALGVDHAEVVRGDLLAAGRLLDDRAASQQDRDAEAELVEAAPGPQHAQIFPFGKHDSFRMPPQSAEDGLDELHGLRRGRVADFAVGLKHGARVGHGCARGPIFFGFSH